MQTGKGGEELDVPVGTCNAAYALGITGYSMLPVYRQGDIIIVSPNAKVRKGDRVVVRTSDGKVTAQVMHRQTAKKLELSSFLSDKDTATVNMKDVDWVARIIWASQ